MAAPTTQLHAPADRPLPPRELQRSAGALPQMPHEILAHYPKGHPLEGALAGRYQLTGAADGSFAYKFAPTPTEVPAAVAARAALTVNHKFTDLDSLCRWLKKPARAYLEVGAAKAWAPWVRARGVLTVFLDEEHPECGSLTVELPRHPQWEHLCALFGEALARPRTCAVAEVHTLVQQMLGGEPPSTNLELGEALVDRGGDARLALSIPAYAGAWPVGAEPRHTALISCTLGPSAERSDKPPPRQAGSPDGGRLATLERREAALVQQGVDARDRELVALRQEIALLNEALLNAGARSSPASSPASPSDTGKRTLLWVNVFSFEQEAFATMCTAVRTRLAKDGHELYLGAPAIVRSASPMAAATETGEE